MYSSPTDRSRARIDTASFTLPPPPRIETLRINRARPRTDRTTDWACPVCDVHVPHVRRAGRQRVYCTNACKQRAYRRRRSNRRSWPFAERRDPRPTRAATRDRVHAIREHRDPSSGRRTSTQMGVTACGAFARMSIDDPTRFGHLRFVGANGRHGGRTCRRCEVLTGAGDGAALLPWRQWSEVSDGVGRLTATGFTPGGL